jgi:hypothetical protein
MLKEDLQMRKKILGIQVAIVLIVLATVSALTVWAGDFKAKRLVQVSGNSPFGALEECGNFPGPDNGIVSLDSEVEPWVDVNPTNSDNIVGAWQQDRWSNGGARGLVAGVSMNGGNNWQSVVIPGLTTCSGGTFQRATDPWLTFAPNGDLYHISLSLDIDTPPGAPGGFGPNALLVSKSTDGGLTWSEPIAIIEDTDRRILNDKETITADPTDSNFVYAAWDRLQITAAEAIQPPPPENLAPPGLFLGVGLGFKSPFYFARTTDGGVTWEPPRKIYDPGGSNQTIGNQIVVLPGGTLINAFNEILNSKNPDRDLPFDFNLAILRSTDKGETWTPHGQPIRAANMQPRTLFTPFPFIGVYDPETGEPIRTADAIPEIAVDPDNGNLYAVWQDARFSNNGIFSNPDLIIDEIAFSQSTDGGFTWSTPIKINLTPTDIALANRQAFLPMVRVANDGTVAVTYYDFRNNDAGEDLKTDVFIVHCHAECNDAANWGNEIRLTDRSFDYRQAPFASGFFTGDYEGLGTDGTDFLPFFSQTHGSDPSSVFFRRVGP